MNSQQLTQEFNEIGLAPMGFLLYVSSLVNANAPITQELITNTINVSAHKVQHYLNILEERGHLSYTMVNKPTRKSKTIEYQLNLINLVEVPLLRPHVLQLYPALIDLEGLSLFVFMLTDAITQHRSDGYQNFTQYRSNGIRDFAQALNISTTTLQKLLKKLMANNLITKSSFVHDEKGKRVNQYNLDPIYQLVTKQIICLPPLARDLYLRSLAPNSYDDITCADYSGGIYLPTLRNFYFASKHRAEEIELLDTSVIIQASERIQLNDNSDTVFKLEIDAYTVYGAFDTLVKLLTVENSHNVSATKGIISVYLRILMRNKESLPILLLHDDDTTTEQHYHIVSATNYLKDLRIVAKSQGWDTTNLK